ncbi:MAG: HAD family hydrolase [Candidatus Aenigmatarchaeota archaeon]
MSTVALDLDGTLISFERIYEIYRKAYEETIKSLKEKGVKIPKELEKHGEEYYRAFREIEGFSGEFDKIYYEILKENSYLKEEEERAKKIYRFIIEKFNPRDIYIVSGNSKAKEIVEKILPEFPKEKIFVTKPGNYEEEKVSLFKKLKIELYIGDLEVDEKIARNANIRFLNVKDIEKEILSV